MITDAMHQLRSKFASKLGIFTHLTPLTTKESLNSGKKICSMNIVDHAAILKERIHNPYDSSWETYLEFVTINSELAWAILQNVKTKNVPDERILLCLSKLQPADIASGYRLSDLYERVNQKSKAQVIENITRLFNDGNAECKAKIVEAINGQSCYGANFVEDATASILGACPEYLTYFLSMFDGTYNHNNDYRFLNGVIKACRECSELINQVVILLSEKPSKDIFGVLSRMNDRVAVAHLFPTVDLVLEFWKETKYGFELLAVLKSFDISDTELQSLQAAIVEACKQGATDGLNWTIVKEFVDQPVLVSLVSALFDGMKSGGWRYREDVQLSRIVEIISDLGVTLTVNTEVTLLCAHLLSRIQQQDSSKNETAHQTLTCICSLVPDKLELFKAIFEKNSSIVGVGTYYTRIPELEEKQQDLAIIALLKDWPDRISWVLENFAYDSLSEPVRRSIVSCLK